MGDTRDSLSIQLIVVPGKRLLQANAISRRRCWPSVVGIALVVLVIAVTLAAAMTTGLLPASPRIDDDTRKIATGVIFTSSYLALAIGKIPGLSIDRAGVALVGACLMVASEALPLEDATKARWTASRPICA